MAEEREMKKGKSYATMALILSLVGVCFPPLLLVAIFLGIRAIKLGAKPPIVAFILSGMFLFAYCGLICTMISSANAEKKYQEMMQAEEYDEILKWLPNTDAFTDKEKQNYLYEVYVASGDYDSAVELVLQQIPEDHPENASEDQIKKIEEIQDKVSSKCKKLIDSCMEKREKNIEVAKNAEEKKKAATEKEEKENEKAEKMTAKEEAQREVSASCATYLEKGYSAEEIASELKEEGYDEDELYGGIVFQLWLLCQGKVSKESAADMQIVVDVFALMEPSNKTYIEFMKTVNEKVAKYEELIQNVDESDEDMEIEFENIYPYTVYVQRKIDMDILSDLTDEYMYFYANDYIWDSVWGDWYGDEEFVLKTKQAFSQKGAIDLYLLDTNVTMTLTTADGFEREVEVFRAFTVEEAENIQQSAEQMESAKQIREQVRKLIKKEYEKLPVSKE